MKSKVATLKSLFIILSLLLSCLLYSKGYAFHPIKVGIATSMSGAYKEFGTEQYRGLKMWVEDVNERGALLGHPIELIAYDNRSDPDLCARLYEKLINEDKVDLLVGPYSSVMTLAVRPIAEKYDFPIMVEGTAPTIWEEEVKNMFGIFTPSERSMEAVLSIASGKDLKRVALAYANTDFPQGVANGVREEVVKQGMQLVLDEEYDETYKTSEEFLGLVKKMKQADPDVVIVASYFLDAVAFTSQAKSAGLEPKMFVFTTGPALIEFGDVLGPDTEGIISTVQWMRSQHMPGSFDFSFRYRQKYGVDADYNAAGGYAAGQIIEAAVRLAGSLERDKIRQQLKTMKFRSLIGHFRVDENGKQVGKPNYIIQWQKGKRRLVYPEELARFEVLYPFPPWGERHVAE